MELHKVEVIPSENVRCLYIQISVTLSERVSKKGRRTVVGLSRDGRVKCRKSSKVAASSKRVAVEQPLLEACLKFLLDKHDFMAR